MPTPLPTPRTSPILVERDPELAALEESVALAAEGHCQVILLSGEAGIGKTRLAREVWSRCEARGFDVIVGRCSEHDLDFPFAPFVDALRQRLVSTGEDPVSILGPHPELVELLPEHGALAATDNAPAASSPEQSKRRLFESLVAFLGKLATRDPLLLLLEDLHWCDPTSLELLELLPRRLANARICILGTCRADEAGRELNRTRATLYRARFLQEIPLAPLTPEGVDGMLAAMLPTPPRLQVASAIHLRTGGNPFLIEEVIASLPEETPWPLIESTLPATVRDVVLQRLEGLDAHTLRVADMAAVAGERVGFDFLMSLTSLDREELLRAVHSLIERQIVVEDRLGGTPGIAFRHALSRDALLDRMLLPERQTLHRMVGDALEARSGDSTPPDTSGELGFHFHIAEVWEKALTHAMLAGHAAWDVHANAEAFAHYRRALDAALALNHDVQIELYCRCGQALALLGAFDVADRYLKTALDAARRRAKPEIELEALHALAGLHASRDYQVAHGFAEQELAVARTRVDRAWEARALNRVGNILTNLMRFPESRRLHEAALQIVDGLDDPRSVADTLDHIGMNRYLSGEIPQARASFGQAASLFSQARDQERVASALTSRGLYLAVIDGACPTDAPPAAYRADATTGLQLSREIGWRAGEAYALVALATVDLGEARLGDALGHAEAALAIADEIEHHQWRAIALLTVGLLHAWLLDDATALRHFTEARDLARALGSRQWVERLEAWIARCESRLGLPETPRTLLTQAIEPASPPTTIGQRRSMLTRIETELAARRLESAELLTRRLLPEGDSPRPAEPVLLRAEVLAAQERLDEADAAYLDARSLAETYGPEGLLWRVAAGRSRLWLAADAPLAHAEAAIVRRQIKSIAGGMPDAELRGNFLHALEVRPWTGPAGRQRTRTAAAPGGLTRREIDVARCVAQGMTNKEIAHSLSITEKTVEMHVGGCLGKLGYSSRSQLAVWTVAQGVAPAPDPRENTGTGT